MSLPILLLPTPLYVPEGENRNMNPEVIWFAPSGTGFSLISLKNYLADVQNGFQPAMQGVLNPFTTMHFRTVWPGYNPELQPETTFSTSGLNRSALAAKVAKYVIHFVFDQVKQKTIPCDIELRQYAIIERKMFVEHVYLAGIINTYSTHWQPILYIRKDFDVKKEEEEEEVLLQFSD